MTSAQREAELRRVAQAGSDRAINRFLERDAKFPDALFKKTRQVVVERKSDPHDGHQCIQFMMSIHQIGDIINRPSAARDADRAQ